MTQKLSSLYRVPKININLPTGGKFYKDEFIKFSIDGSLPVRAMTAKDELMLKSPDALLNGDCLLHIIQSCVPDIKEPRKLSAPDIDAILLGIFYASYGPNLEFKAKCPVCSHDNDFEVPIRQLLDITEPVEYPALIDIHIGEVEGVDTTFRVEVTPYTFETNTKQQLVLFEHNKMLQIMTNDNNSDEDKLKAFNSSFRKLVDLKFDSVLSCITRIEIRQMINNEIQVENVTDRADIKDFLMNASKAFVDPIVDKVEMLNSKGVNKIFHAECRGVITTPAKESVEIDENGKETVINQPETKKTCGHLWDAGVEFNPVNFFVKGSSRQTRLK